MHNSRLSGQKCPTVDNVDSVSLCEVLNRPTSDIAISCRPQSSLQILGTACQCHRVWHTVPCVWPACIEAQSQQRPMQHQTLCQCQLACCTKYHSQDCCESQGCLFVCLYGMLKCNMTQLNKDDSLMQMQLQAGVSDLAV